MRIRDVSWRRYSLPFVAPFSTAHGESIHREGLILRIQTDDGLTGLGEAAPLPEFGGGTVGQSEALLKAIAPDLPGRIFDDAERLIDSSLPVRLDTSALRYAFDTVLLDLRARHAGVRLADLLGSADSSDVPVNATIGQTDTDMAVNAARDAVSRGIRTIKLKVGVGKSFAGEVARVASVRDAIGPGATLRLDANGAWDVQQAIDMINALVTFDIELIEQPVAPDDLEGLARVRRSVPIEIAADEAVTGLETARRVIEAEAAGVLVVKPMACGGLREARRIIDLARASGLTAIITSSLESGIGVAGALHLAATLPIGFPACGLATTALLADDLILEPLQIVVGRMRLPAGPGLGVTLDEERLDTFAVSAWRRASYSSISQNSDTRS